MLRFLRSQPEPAIQGAADARTSVISSVHDQSQPDDALIELALAAADHARRTRLMDLEKRCSEPDLTWVRSWPGEHYRLLGGLVEVLKPSSIVEIGTFKGHGALALAERTDVPVVTYDIVQWNDFPETALRVTDMAPVGRIEQRLGDLGDAAYRDTQVDAIRAADLIFIDGPKDGAWEQHAIPDILDVLTDRRRLIVLDDIRLMAMVQLWRDLPHVKLDLTSFGHWSGTGLLWTV
jgi:predicted O-methyltransferase YrrM